MKLSIFLNPCWYLFPRVDTLERDVSPGPGRCVSRAPGQLETAGAAAARRGQLASHPALLSWSRVNSDLLGHRTSKRLHWYGFLDQNYINSILKSVPRSWWLPVWHFTPGWLVTSSGQWSQWAGPGHQPGSESVPAHTNMAWTVFLYFYVL